MVRNTLLRVVGGLVLVCLALVSVGERSRTRAEDPPKSGCNDTASIQEICPDSLYKCNRSPCGDSRGNCTSTGASVCTGEEAATGKQYFRQTYSKGNHTEETGVAICKLEYRCYWIPSDPSDPNGPGQCALDKTRPTRSAESRIYSGPSACKNPA